MPRRPFVLVASIFAAASTLGVPTACEESVPAPYLLVGPRVLAIRSTPPEVLPGSSVTLDALIYAPAGTAAPTYQWTWCATLSSTLTCGTTAAALQSLLDPDGNLGVTIDYDLGTSPTATFTLPAAITPSVIAAACERRLEGDGGIETLIPGEEDAGADDSGVSADGGPVFAGGTLGCSADASTWTIDIVLTASVGAYDLQAVRTLTVDFTAPATVNTNPTVEGIAPYTDAGLGADAAPQANPDDQGDGGVDEAGIGTTAEDTITVAAMLPANATDIYSRPIPGGAFFDAAAVGLGDLDASVCIPNTPASSDAGSADGGLTEDAGALEDGGDASTSAGCTLVTNAAYESLDLAWFVESGELNSATTSMPSVFVGSQQDWNAALVNGWSPPTGGGSYQMIVVARDNRGGVGWYRQTVSSFVP